MDIHTSDVRNKKAQSSIQRHASSIQHFLSMQSIFVRFFSKIQFLPVIVARLFRLDMHILNVRAVSCESPLSRSAIYPFQ